MPTFAEIGPNNIVQRVVVADSQEWCEQHLGGVWVPTVQGASPARYAGPGMACRPNDTRTFLFSTEVA